MNRTIVHVDDMVMFTHSDIILLPAGVDAAFFNPERLVRAVQAAVPLQRDAVFCDHMKSGDAPLAQLGDIDINDFIAALKYEKRRQRQEIGALRAKIAATHERRREFNLKRADLILKMIEAGIPYECAVERCDLSVALTVDHKVALSRGGTDDLDNLQFLCRNHNSQKSDK